MAERGEGYHQRVLAPLVVLRALLSNVSFAIAQIAAIALASTIGIALRQLPDYALTNASDYAIEMGRLRAAYEPTLGPLLGIFERLGFFRVFTSPWFIALLALLAVSIVVCTLDRVPKIWASTAPSRVAQPDAFFAASLPGRGTLNLSAALPHGSTAERASAAATLLHRFGWETSIDAPLPAAGDTPAGVTIVHADKHRRSYRFTLVMHAGLVLILVGAAVSGAFGYTQGILLTDGEELPVGAIGAKGTIVIQNRGFSAPRSASGAFLDFATDLVVYRDGAQVAEQTVRVNEPLRYEGWSFHQNFFGPSAKLEVRDAVGDLLWTGDAPFTAVADGSPYATLPIPGSDAGLELQLRRHDTGAGTGGGGPVGSAATSADGEAVVFIVASRPDPSGARSADGSPLLTPIFASVIAPGESASAPGAGFSVTLESIGSYTGIVARRDPGAPIVWLAAVLIVGGLAFTLRRPRTRLWLRLAPGSSEVAAALVVDRGADLMSSARTLERVATILGGESA